MTDDDCWLIFTKYRLKREKMKEQIMATLESLEQAIKRLKQRHTEDIERIEECLMVLRLQCEPPAEPEPPIEPTTEEDRRFFDDLPF
jgi:hypothetical protein